jgi:outer membrane protein assembly factor BamB
VNIPVLVGSSYAFASPLSGDGHLHAFNKATGVEAWKWDPSVTIGNVSAPAFDINGTIYFSSDSPKQVIALKVVSNVPSAADHWGSAYKGSAAQKTTAPVIDTTVDGLTTEPVIDANGVIYFATGTANAKVFALITDSPGPLAPVAGSTWPRVGYDNCNSSNTSFACQ